MLLALAIAFQSGGGREDAPALASGQSAAVESTAVSIMPAADRAAVDTCLPAQRAIRFYRARTNETRRLFSRSVPDRIAWPTCYLARRAARTWQARARSALRRYAYLYDWRAWLPANWIGVGTCETHMNFQHSNSSFRSAFGISVREYDADAAYFGAPPWSVRHTPRDQYDAARGHYARFGDGWTCPGP